MVLCEEKWYVMVIHIRMVEGVMKISYKKLWVMLAQREMSKQEFREKLEIASGTMTKLNKGQEVSLTVLLRICEFFDCNIGDICDAVKN